MKVAWETTAQNPAKAAECSIERERGGRRRKARDADLAARLAPKCPCVTGSIRRQQAQRIAAAHCSVWQATDTRACREYTSECSRGHLKREEKEAGVQDARERGRPAMKVQMQVVAWVLHRSMGNGKGSHLQPFLLMGSCAFAQAGFHLALNTPVGNGTILREQV